MNPKKVLIIGGGISGLSLAAKLAQKKVPFLLLEKEDRLGGQIRTVKEKGYTFEVGPNTGSVSNPEVTELFEYLEPLTRLEEADPAANNRWIWKGDRFHLLPSGPISGLTTPLFAFPDKFRILLEPFRPKGNDPLESVGSLAQRRLGKSFVEYAVDPFVGGIYAGDPYKLTTQYALPKLYNLEQNYGSFIGGSMKLMKQKKSGRDKKATKKVFSAEGGLENLVNALVTKLQGAGTMVKGVSSISLDYHEAYEWNVKYTDQNGASHEDRVSHVVSTVRSDQLKDVLPSEMHASLAPIMKLRYAPMIEISVGFDHLPQIRANAFGGLVPSREKRKVLGILFPSSCFRGRTPFDDSRLFTLFMGGLRNSTEFEGLSREEITQIGLHELYDMMKIDPSIKPDMIHFTSYARAIPQYDATSGERLERIAELEKSYPGLYLAGGIRDGIGLAHRIRQGTLIGADIAESFSD